MLRVYRETISSEASLHRSYVCFPQKIKMLYMEIICIHLQCRNRFWEGWKLRWQFWWRTRLFIKAFFCLEGSYGKKLFLFGAFRTTSKHIYIYLPLLSTCVGLQGCFNLCGLPSPSLGSTSATSHCKKDLKLFWTEDVKGNLSINRSATSVNTSLASPVCQAHNPTVVEEHHAAKKPDSSKVLEVFTLPEEPPAYIYSS